MKAANIHITGQIGTSYNPDGTVNKKGVELQDIISQVEKNKDAETKNFIITSEGGSVQTGKAIAKYIASLPNAFTIASQFCASIATEIHLSVPLANRKIVAGTEYFLHAPLMNNVNGNADQLVEMAEYVRDAEKEMLSMYTKATGMDKAAIEGLMKQETSLTSEQAVELHFASEIIPSIDAKIENINKNIIAFFDKKQTNNNEITNQMESFAKKLTDKFEALTKLVAEKLGVIEAVWKDEKTKDGKVIKVEMAGEKIAKGDSVTDEAGLPTPNASYTLADETVIKTDADSKVSEVNAPQPAASTDTPEVAALKTELEAAKKENTELKEVTAKIEAKMTALASTITSKGKPVIDASVQFRQRNVPTEKEKDLSAWEAKRKESMTAKNAEITKKTGL